jgi:exonuclease III
MKNIVVLYFLFVGLSGFAQEAAININFDDTNSSYQAKTTETLPSSIWAANPNSFSEGISGRALDLSENVPVRMPIQLQKGSAPDFSEAQSFTVQVWIKTLPSAQQGTPIVGNKKSSAKADKGWGLFSTQAGGWQFAISDGKNHYNYKPSAQRMPINDGKWHQLAFVLDRKKDEVWLYYDGQNVAIYNTPGITGLSSEWVTTLGGTASNWSYYGQMEAFNGFMDEFKIWDSAISEESIRNEYLKYSPLEETTSIAVNKLKVLSWNIWGGGREFGTHVNLKRVIETIKGTQADVVTLIETYGSGEKIADALGYHFYLISSNLSIMSRYPIKETIKAFKPFNFGGAVLRLNNNQEVVVFDTWLHYLPDYHSNIIKGEMTAKELEKDESNTRLAEVKAILKAIRPYTKNANAIPVIMAGDFNTNSHLDWTRATQQAHLGYTIDWPVTKAMEKAGYIDSFREVKPDPLKYPGYSYWPFSYEQTGKRFVKDRIDYIFYKGEKLHTISSEVIDYHPVMFPSDHAFVLSTFRLDY